MELESLKCSGECNANCCRYMMMRLDNSDHALWAKHHGFEVYEADGVYAMKINKECNQLKDGKCMVYGTSERPIMCEMYFCKKSLNFKKYE